MLTLNGITKRFGRVQALADVTLEFQTAEIHAVLGENGAGKSTMMHVVAGLLRPDAGFIALDGRTLPAGSPSAARRAGIGMVHQHFTLVDQLTVAENLALSLPSPPRLRLRAATIGPQVSALAERLGLDIGDPQAVTGTLPVGMRQRIEIVKALARQTRILILDEPTAVLTSEEVHHLFAMLRRLRDAGRLILFITHKLREVVELADRVTIMRRGRPEATRRVTGLSEETIASMMIGAPIPARRPRPAIAPDAPERLRVQGLATVPEGGRQLRRLSFSVRAGEVFGIAGVSGNGQEELFESLAGLRHWAAGALWIDGQRIIATSPAAVSAAGLGYIPPDRHRDGLVLSMSVAENAVLNPALLKQLGSGIFLSRRSVLSFAAELVKRLAVQTDSLTVPVATLSGGNQQRLIVGRQLAPRPNVLVAVNPTRGLDVASAQNVYETLNQFAADGRAIVLISTDLEEVLDLSHRVAVLFGGRLSDPLTPPIVPEMIGRLMAGAMQ